MSLLKPCRVLAVALVAISTFAFGLGGQEVESSAAPLQACYLPATGLVYLIGLEGLPEECQGEDHARSSLR